MGVQKINVYDKFEEKIIARVTKQHNLSGRLGLTKLKKSKEYVLIKTDMYGNTKAEVIADADALQYILEYDINMLDNYEDLQQLFDKTIQTEEE